jgi:DNA-binding IclR family transcriptional regulator
LGFLVLNNLEVRQVAAPFLRRLVDEVEETVNLAVLDNHEVVYIDRVGSKHLVNVNRPVGSRLPAYCTSAGKAMLAYLPADQLETIFDATSWEKYTKYTITSLETLKENLALIRERGFSDSNGEMLQELRDVSAPIFQHDGQVVAAINISVPSHRVSYERLIGELGPKVVMTGWQISGALGYNVKRAA